MPAGMGPPAAEARRGAARPAEADDFPPRLDLIQLDLTHLTAIYLDD